jgi:RNA 2',3'-cyclic 3'-phosphodiesterase
MRMFLAVDLRATLGQPACDWGRAITAAIGPRHAAGLSWVPAARIHVTLHFFGALTRDAVDGLPAALGHALPDAPFDVSLGTGGTFPAAGRPRVLWLGLSAGAGAIARLRARLVPLVAGIGEPDRHGAFSPHVTIARVRRDAPPGLGLALREATARTPAPPDRARVDAVTLFESVASATGPTYVPVAQLPLVGRGPSR